MTEHAKRIARLRELMKERRIDAYVIPTSDYHQSENEGAHFRYREYITGFTGSAGTAVITQDEAGLWTDGRYFTQAEHQLKGSGVKLMRIGEDGTPTVLNWLLERLSEGDTLAFDGRVISMKQGIRNVEGLGAKGIKVETDIDLVGDIWPERPPLPDNPCFYLEEKWTGESSSSKLARTREKMREFGADVHLLSAIDDICWTLNFRGFDIEYYPLVLSYALIWMDHVDLFIDEHKLNDEILAHFAEDNVVLHPYGDIYDGILAVEPEHTMLIYPEKINYELYRHIRCKTVERHNPAIMMKSIKNPTEIKNIKNAQLKDSVAITKFIFWVKHNYNKMEITEMSASEKLTSLRCEQKDYIQDSFEPLQSFGAHGAMMHYTPTPETDVVLKEGGMLLSDTGGGYFDGSTDITRTTVLGHIDPQLKKYYTAVYRAMQHLASAKFLFGNHGYSLDVLCREPIWELGMDYKCGTGHGFGYLGVIHEPPVGFRWYISEEKKDNKRLYEGMCMTIEPGIYVDGEFGIRIENDVVVVNAEKNEYGQFMYFDMMTFVPIDLDGILPEELNAAERDWLNDYHRQCYEKLSPFMTEEENEWLKEYTRAI